MMNAKQKFSYFMRTRTGAAAALTLVCGMHAVANAAIAGPLTREQAEALIIERSPPRPSATEEVDDGQPDDPEITSSGPFFSDPFALEEAFGKSRLSSLPGESIDLRTGALTLSAVDLRVPGNGGLDLVVSRTRTPTFLAGTRDTFVLDRLTASSLADWQLDVPYIRLRSVESYGWNPPNATQPKRELHTPLRYNVGFKLPTADFIDRAACFTRYLPDPKLTWDHNQNPTTFSFEDFDGVYIEGLAGGVRVELLNGSTALAQSPYVSLDNWAGWCVETQHTSFRRSDGQVSHGAWFVKAPNGLKYLFDEPTRGVEWKYEDGSPSQRLNSHMRVFVSRIEDANGNWIKYEYDDSLILEELRHADFRDLREFAYVKRITTSDGREVSFEWECNPFAVAGGSSNCPVRNDGARAASPYRLKSFSFDGRTWQFRYNDTAHGDFKSRFLESVTLPSGLKWQYAATLGAQAAAACGTRTPQAINYSVTYPEGGKVDYTLRSRLFVRRSLKPTSRDYCWHGSAVTKRVVNDLREPPSTTSWCYGLFLQNNFDPVWTHVLSASRFDAYAFRREVGSGNEGWMEGLLVEHQVRQPLTQCAASVGPPPGSDYLRKTTFGYLNQNNLTAVPPDSDTIGRIRYDEVRVRWRPMNLRRIDEPGIGTYETRIDRFSSGWHPALVRESMTNVSADVDDLSRIWRTAYRPTTIYSDVYRRGDVIERCLVESGDAESCPHIGGILQGTKRSYDSRGNLESESSFGKQRSMTYHSSGDVHVITDERNETTTLTSYKRGVPQSIAYPGNESETLVVSDSGKVTQVTNARQKTTQFGYDHADRLESVDYPVGDGVSISWSANGRTRTIERGRRRVVSRFDGFGRFVEETVTDVARGESVATVVAYDDSGRRRFESYPSASIATAAHGLRYEYDALDRLTSTTRTVDEKSATIQYGQDIRFDTDFRGNVVTRYFRSYGEPSYETVTWETAPITAVAENGATSEQQFTTVLHREKDGRLNSVTRGGVTRRYGYDARQEVVKEYAPELGAPTIEGKYNVGICRNGAGNVTGKSIGSVCTSPSSANLMQVDYDARGRVDYVSYKDGATPAVDYAYTSTGQVKKITKGAVTLEFDHDDSDQVIAQTHGVDGYRFKIGYLRDSLGNVETIVYPSGKAYALSPDAWGRPRSVGEFVNSVSYHPSGAVASVQYTNGFVSSIALTNTNAIETLSVAKAGAFAVDLEYDYDANGNVITVIDHVRPERTRSLDYDELNRLVGTTYSMVSMTPYRRGYHPSGEVAFDMMPNRLTRFAYDPVSNRLGSISGTVSRTMQYDSRGNITSDGQRAFEFAFDGNLRRSTLPISRSFVYDGRDRMVKETTGGIVKYLVYAGENLLFEFEPATDTYVEHVYLGAFLVGSRRVVHASSADSNGNGVADTQEFLNPTH